MQHMEITAGINCRHCQGPTIKYGKTGNKQRYYCKTCNRTQLKHYENLGCKACTASAVALHLKEGCGIRSISRLLSISVNTVLKKIVTIADAIKKPAIAKNRIYEMDELKTYVKTKTNEYWLIYAIDRDSRAVVDLKVGKRNKKNMQRVTATLLLADCKKIYTDKLNIYNSVIPKKIHHTPRYGTNHIERNNLTLRTHLKRLGRKTIAFSKSLLMLEACVKIYFWYA